MRLLKLEHSLIVDPLDHTKFLYPDDNGDIVFDEGAKVFLSCASHNKFESHPDMAAIFTCVSQEIFEADGKNFSFYDLSCQQIPVYSLVDGKLVGIDRVSSKLTIHRFEIGFYTDTERKFLSILDVYYSDDTHSTIYVKSKVPKSIAGSQYLDPKPKRFDQKYCCDPRIEDMDHVYKHKIQEKSFATQLLNHPMRKPDNNYLRTNPGSKFLFHRSQLASKYSFVYGVAATTAFTYLNVAPQWLIIKQGNWIVIETHINEMVRRLKRNVTVITGVHDRLKLNDTVDKVDKEMFLYNGLDAGSVFPIPLYFFKLVIDPEHKEGVVFVVVNNPYIIPGPEYHTCEKPIFWSEQIMMPNEWHPKNVTLGYSYMCTVSDFLNKTGYVLAKEESASSISKLLYIPPVIRNYFMR